MSFYGKKFKKVKVENMDEILAKIGTGNKALNLLQQTDTLTGFDKNADGSIQYIVLKGGENVINQRVVPNKEEDVTTSDGKPLKAFTIVEGDSVKTTLTLADGKVMHMDRYFDGNNMKMEVYVPGLDVKGIVYHEAA